MTGRRCAAHRVTVLVIVLLAFVAVAGRGGLGTTSDESPASLSVLDGLAEDTLVLPSVAALVAALLVLGVLVLRLASPVPVAVRVSGRRRAPPSAR